jgi:hypothetical protein
MVGFGCSSFFDFLDILGIEILLRRMEAKNRRKTLKVTCILLIVYFNGVAGGRGLLARVR